MLRRLLAVLVLCVVAGCQDYNFNPVGRCVIQPGTTRVAAQGSSVADVLFVVDDSGSMAPQQASLARNFQSFIDALTAAQNDRKASGLEPFEFHIAITTSSIFEAWQASGAPKCGTPSAGTCTIQNPTFSWKPGYSYQCTTAGLDCPDVIPQYHNFSGCIAGVGADKQPYPAGDFVAGAGNPRVLHFTKDLFDGSATSATALQALVAQFQKNIAVGTCGSGMEQHLEAARLAVQKAVAGTQPGLTAGEWPHPSAKLVVVWVGDEDDCSNPDTLPAPDPTKTLYFTPTKQSPGNDVCTDDEALPEAQQRLFKIADYATFFTGLNRPFSAAFIYSAVNCRDDGKGNIVCDPGTCSCQCPAACASCGPTAQGICNIPAECSGKSTGTRFSRLSTALKSSNIKTLEASVCDADFGTTLQKIAALVVPPPSLRLATPPAASDVAIVSAEKSGGDPQRCSGPAATSAETTGSSSKDWWFVDCTAGLFSGEPTQCIAINPCSQPSTRPASCGSHPSCEPDPGLSYVAQYIGIVPSPTPENPQGGCLVDNDCTVALGGAQGLRCDLPPGQARGSCVCGP
ncbi:MAG TPA: hypothetical protein VFP65_16190 [Anaeromyxobacteraceae bacterium]|nr:hypothetical protein [Anaeromyxobacteraceae bacterium]